MRHVLFALAVVASGCLLALLAADVEWSAPLAPVTEVRFAGNEFAPVYGSAAPRDTKLEVTSIDEEVDLGLASHRADGFDASRFSTLRYRFDRFPRTLELSLIFRTAEDPADARTISLPWPGSTTGTFDLGRLPGWKGHIIEIGFAEFPTALIVPPGQRFEPFELVDAALWSPSWQGDLAALATDWFADWPWTQRSVHALGRDTETPRALSIVPCAAIAALVVIALWLAFYGWRHRQRSLAAAVSLGVVWVLLDLVWQAGLWGRLATTRAVYAALPLSRRETTVADADVAAAAARVRDMLADEPLSTRVLVYGNGSGYELLRFIWHALPLNAGDYLHAAVAGEPLPDGTVIVFFDTDEWRSSRSFRKVLAHSTPIFPAPVLFGDGFDESRLAVFRYRHED